jgi:hypothetical protein
MSSANTSMDHTHTANICTCHDGASTYIASAKIVEDKIPCVLYDIEIYEKIEGVLDTSEYCSTRTKRKRGSKTPETLAKVAEATALRAVEAARTARMAVSAKHAATQHTKDTQRRLNELSRDVIKISQGNARQSIKKTSKRTISLDIILNLILMSLVGTVISFVMNIPVMTLLRESTSFSLVNRTKGVTGAVIRSADNLQRFSDRFVESLNLHSKLSDMALNPYDTLERTLDDLNQTLVALTNLTSTTVNWEYDKFEVLSILNRTEGRVKRDTAVGVINNVTQQIVLYQHKVKEYYNAYLDLLELVEIYAQAVNNLTLVWDSMLDTMDDYARNAHAEISDLANMARRMKRSVSYPTWAMEMRNLREVARVLKQITATIYQYSLQAYWLQARNDHQTRFSNWIWLIPALVPDKRVSFFVTLSMIIVIGDTANVPKPVAESLIRLPDVTHLNNHTDHCDDDDVICQHRPRTLELGQSNTAEQCSKAVLDCATLMAISKDKCSEGLDDEEHYLGCSKGGLPQLGYSGTYSTVGGRIIMSHLRCSKHMNLACLDDEILLSLLSSQPDNDACICPILAMLVDNQTENHKQDETVIVYSDYLCVSRGDRCWKVKHDYSDYCCPDTMQLARRGESYVKIDICACSISNWKYTRLWFQDVLVYKRYIHWAMTGIIFVISARKLGNIAAVVLGIAYFTSMASAQCTSDIWAYKLLLNKVDTNQIVYKGDVTLKRGGCLNVGSGELHINDITQSRRYTYIGEFPEVIEKVSSGGDWCCRSGNPGFTTCCQHYQQESEKECSKIGGISSFGCKHTEDFSGSGCFDFLAGAYVAGWVCLKPCNHTWTVYQIRSDNEGIMISVYHNITGVWKNETIKAGVIKDLDQLRVNVLGNVGLVPPNFITVRRKASDRDVWNWYGCEEIFDKSELCRSTHWDDASKIVDKKCIEAEWTIWPGRTDFAWKRTQFSGLFAKFRKLDGVKQLQIQRGSSILVSFPVEYFTVAIEAKLEIVTSKVKLCDQVQRLSTSVRSATVDDSYLTVVLTGNTIGKCRVNIYVDPCLLLGDLSVVVENAFSVELRVSCGALLPTTFKIEYDKHAYTKVSVTGLKRNWTAAWQSTYAMLNITEALAEKYVKGFNFDVFSKVTGLLNFDIFGAFSSLGTRLVHYIVCAVFVYLGMTSLLGGNMVFTVLFAILSVVSYVTAHQETDDRTICWTDISILLITMFPIIVTIMVHFLRLTWCNIMRISHYLCSDFNLAVILRVFDLMLDIRMLYQITITSGLFVLIKLVNVNWRHLRDIMLYWPYKIDKSYYKKDVRKTCIKVIVPDKIESYHIGAGLSKSEPLSLVGRKLFVGGGMKDLIPTANKTIRLSYVMAQTYNYFKAHKASKSSKFCLEGILYYAQIYQSKIDR